MVIVFHAKCVAIDDMKRCWLVGFADDEHETQMYLTLTRSFEDDEQDVQLGMNTYHVQRDDQHWSCYGGIERLELHRDRTVVRFAPAGASQLGADVMEIAFDVDEAQFARLARQLERIFSGTACLTVVSP